MRKHVPTILFLLALAFSYGPALAQDAPPDFRDELLMQFNAEAQKLLALAEAMPAETYDWRPSDGVMSVRNVYMHVAEYNYTYPQRLQVEVPDGVDVEGLADLSGKPQVLDALRASIEHMRTATENLPESHLDETATLYGRDLPGWSVLLQLVTHMSEHVGQSIAYARMNEVVPPWSR